MSEFGAAWPMIWRAAVSAMAMVLTVVVVVRVVGLRSFAKMSSFDFAATVAIGSVMASTAMSGSSLLVGMVAVVSLLGTQLLLAIVRRTGAAQAMDNTPMVVMVGDEPWEDHLRMARMTDADLRAKLREANACDLASVIGVVLETTGDVSVLHGDQPLHPDLVVGVRGADRLMAHAAGRA